MKKIIIALGICIASSTAIPNMANAITLQLSSGISGPFGVTDQGSFAPWTPVETVDFNGLASTNFSKTLNSGVTVTFSGITGGTGIVKNSYAPPGPDDTNPSGTNTSLNTTATQPNTSDYLGVASGNPVTITFTGTPLKFFGVDFGFFDADNLIKVTTALSAGGSQITCIGTSSTIAANSGTVGTCDVVNDLTLQINNQQAAYISLYTGAGETQINQLQLIQVTSTNGGLETDNYAFSDKIPPALTPTTFTPVPFDFSPTLGILSLASLYGIHKFRKLSMK